MRDIKKRKKKKGAQKKRGENSRISPPLDPRLGCKTDSLSKAEVCVSYSLCYKRPLTDILIVGAISSFIASYPVRNKDFGYIYKKKIQKKSGIFGYL